MSIKIKLNINLKLNIKKFEKEKMIIKKTKPFSKPKKLILSLAIALAGVFFIVFLPTLARFQSSGTVQSTVVFEIPGYDITKATLWVSDSQPTNTNITYYLSADNGDNWEEVTSGVEHTFTNQDNQLKWKAELTTTDTSVSPIIGSIGIDNIVYVLAIPDPPTNLQTKAQGTYYTNPYNVQDLTPDFSWTLDEIQTAYRLQVTGSAGFIADWADDLTDWGYRQSADIEALGAGDVIKITVGADYTNFWNNVQSDGDDVRFADSYGNVLEYEVDTWNYQTSASLRARANQALTPPGDKLYLYYGNALASSAEISLVAGTPTALNYSYEFQPLVWDSGEVTSEASTDITYGGEALSWGNVYYWRVKTSSSGAWSDWTDGTDKFKTNSEPVASFDVSQDGESFDFDGSDSFDYEDSEHAPPSGFNLISALEGSIATYEWDWDYGGSFNPSGDAGVTISKDSSEIGAVVALRVTDDGGLTDIASQSIEYMPHLKTEHGDVYAKEGITGDNIRAGRYNATYLIQSGGGISNFKSESGTSWEQTGYTGINFPGGTYQYVNVLGKLDWDGLKCPGSGDCTNKYGNSVEIITDISEVDNPLAGKIYYYDGDLTISSAKQFSTGSGSTRGNGLIMVNGDLTINANVTYTGTASALKNIAAVGFLVKGDVIISSSVTNLVGAFVVIGDGLNTCDMVEVIPGTKYSIAAHCGLVKTGSNVPTVKNDTALDVSGLMFAKRFFFQRSIKSTDPNVYAERVTYDENLFLNPPPGMEDFIGGLPTWRNVAP